DLRSNSLVFRHHVCTCGCTSPRAPSLGEKKIMKKTSRPAGSMLAAVAVAAAVNLVASSHARATNLIGFSDFGNGTPDRINYFLPDTSVLPNIGFTEDNASLR